MSSSNVNSSPCESGANLCKEPAEAIVDAFAERAKTLGVKAIMMSDIARDLGMSKKTLYKYFAGKEEVVQQLIVRWESRFELPAYNPARNIVAQLEEWVEKWLRIDGQYSMEFWAELQAEYPTLHNHYRNALVKRLQELRGYIEPFLRDGMDHNYTWLAYRTLIKQAALPETHQALDLCQRDCVSKALQFWMQAALDPEKVNSPDTSS